MLIKFTVPGEPVAKARPRVFYNKRLGRAMAYTPKATMSFEEHVRMCSLEHRPEAPLDGPISLTLRVYKSIPKSFSKIKVRQAIHGEIKPISRPDLDNFLKSISDALNKIIWKDDSQIVSCIIQKMYSLTPRVEVEVVG